MKTKIKRPNNIGTEVGRPGFLGGWTIPEAQLALGRANLGKLTVVFRPPHIHRILLRYLEVVYHQTGPDEILVGEDGRYNGLKTTCSIPLARCGVPEAHDTVRSSGRC